LKIKKVKRKNPTYITLFSGGGVGCQSFTYNEFDCIATNEIISKRLDVQKNNDKCKYDSGYIYGDISKDEIKSKIYDEINLWEKNEKIKEIEVVIATPPCQGMSVANHHKIDELGRNSLVVQSLIMTKKINPKVFVFENVRTFLNTFCQDIDGNLKPIKEAIESNLTNYNIHSEVINFKNYGNPSQRTRTIVIGTRKDLKNISPLDLLPNREPVKTIRETIGNLQSLKTMGEITSDDIYHSFRKYPKEMEKWIKNLDEGQSAFENTKIDEIPHTIKNNQRVVNQNKNGDKYRRCYWDSPMYCIHTRNDILASQMTVHPSDNRVFSIRELMKLMSIQDEFNWSDISFDDINQMSIEEKREFLKKEELNIRRCIGESVPPVIFDSIAKKIKSIFSEENISDSEISNIIQSKELHIHSNLKKFLKSNLKNFSYDTLSRIIELANMERTKHAAYYTTKDVCFSLVEDLPSFDNDSDVTILEPSVGSGNFLPMIIEKYQHCKSVKIDVIDIDKNALEILKILIKKIEIPRNTQINFIHSDFLTLDSESEYDVIIGNPPFGKVTNDKKLVKKYKTNKYNQKTNNLFAFFIEDSIKRAKYISLIVPKSLLSTPEFNQTRELMSKYNIEKIVDFGEKAFDVKIETIGFVLKKTKVKSKNKVKIESFGTGEKTSLDQSYVTSDKFPYWLIYRNEFFDSVAKKIKFDILSAFRDRQITKRITKSKGNIRVLKSRNIENNSIKNIPNYDCYIDDDQIDSLAVGKYLNAKKAILIPNLTYFPRACFMPKNVICDGSVAIAFPKNGTKINKKTLEYYSTDEFREFYRIARNKSTRSMNIDSNSIFFFGKVN
jgi:DNA (cytosine-5)-methyltransferase 1